MMGYIAMSARKSKEATEFFAPLSYGRNKEPAHDQLLRRGRATMFATEREAWAALEKTLKQATDEGAPWPKKYQYAIIEVDGPWIGKCQNCGHEHEAPNV